MDGLLRKIVMIVGVIAIGLLLYVNYHRGGNAVNTGGDLPIGVLVARHEIQKGTTGAAIKTGLFEVVTIPRRQIVSGALVDPAALTGKVAVKNIDPGAQLTSADFARCVCISSPPNLPTSIPSKT